MWIFNQNRVIEIYIKCTIKLATEAHAFKYNFMVILGQNDIYFDCSCKAFITGYHQCSRQGTTIIYVCFIDNLYFISSTTFK